MPRSTNTPASKKRRKKVLKRAKGFFSGRRKLFRTAHETVMRAMVFATRDRKQRKRVRGEHANFAQIFMSVQEQSQRAEQDQRRGVAFGFAVEFARRHAQENQHEQHQRGAREARSVVQFKHGLGDPCKAGSDPVIEGAVFEERLAGNVGHQPFAMAEHLVHDVGTDRVFGFPWVVTEQSG